MFVKRKDGGHLCKDYRGLNAVSMANAYSLPLIKDLFQEVSKGKVFTKLDLRDPYHRRRTNGRPCSICAALLRIEKRLVMLLCPQLFAPDPQFWDELIDFIKCIAIYVCLFLLHVNSIVLLSSFKAKACP